MFKRIIFIFLFILTSSYIFSVKKIDVLDSLLQNIIDYFSESIPKFINKYGENKFVADEPMTRGTILLLLYEYDQALKKELKIQDIDLTTSQSLQKKIESLEKKFLSLQKQISTTTISSQPTQEKFDIIEIINELSPNMPILLDKSLEKSEVFNSLKREIDILKIQKSDTQTLQKLTTNEKNMQTQTLTIYNLTNKMENLEKELKDLKKKQIELLTSITNSNDQQIKQLEKNYSKLVLRLEDLEKTFSKKQAVVSEKKYQKEKITVGEYISILTKISLGLSIFSLLFIAR